MVGVGEIDGEVVGRSEGFEGLAGEAFDGLEERAFLVVAEGDGDAGGTGAAGSSDAVDVGLGFDGEVVVEDVGDSVDIEAACGDIGGDEDASAALAEGVEGALALGLGLVAVDGVGADACEGETPADLVGAVLGPCEDDGTGDAIGEEVVEERLLAGARHVVDVFFDPEGGDGGRGDGDPDGIAEERAGEGHDLTRHRGGEQEGLTVARGGGGDASDGIDEAHVEHAVGLVEDEEADGGEIGMALLHEVHETARGGDDDVDSALEVLDLVELADAPEDDGARDAGVPAVGLETLGDLSGEFASGGEDERAGEGVPSAGLVGREGAETREEGEGEGGGLAGAGLGDAEEVAAVEDGRDGSGLDGRGGGVGLFGEGAEDEGIKGEGIERVQGNSSVGGTRRAERGWAVERPRVTAPPAPTDGGNASPGSVPRRVLSWTRSPTRNLASGTIPSAVAKRMWWSDPPGDGRV